VSKRPDSAILDTFHDDYLVGLLAVRQGVVSRAHLDEAVQIRLRSRPTPRLTDVLLALTGLKDAAMLPVFYTFYSLLLGSVAVRLDLITEVQLHEALEAQMGQDPKPLLGSVLVALGFITPDALDRLLREQEAAWTDALGDGSTPERRAGSPAPRPRTRARSGPGTGRSRFRTH
jgi:hypothetical protein